MARKFICVWAPWFRTEIETHTHPEWVHLPLAIYSLESRQRDLLEVSPCAAHAGLTVGMSLREAQLRCPKAILVADDRPRYGKAFLPVIDALDCFSPQVEETDLGMAFADATGLTLLYGSDLELCRKIQIAIRESTVHRVNVGLAGSKFAAEIVARTADPSGIGAVLETDAMHLAQLPLTMLPLSKKTIKQLNLLGVCDLGAFAALPANTVRSKYGVEGHIAQKMASGLDDRPIKPRLRPLGFEETTEFEWGEQNLDRVAFAIQSMATRLAHRL